MNTATDLLRSLAGVHASHVGRAGASARGSSSAAPGTTPSGESFAMLLEQARSGEIESGVPLAVPSHLGVDLNASQVERLSKAADRAEVQGAGKALVLMDGKGFVIDVVSRTVTGMIDPASAGVVDGIDAVVLAGADGEGAPGTTGANRASGSVLTLPRSSLAMQPNIAKLLEQGFGRDEGASAA